MHYCILQLLQVLMASFHNSVLMCKSIMAEKSQTDSPLNTKCKTLMLINKNADLNLIFPNFYPGGILQLGE